MPRDLPIEPIKSRAGGRIASDQLRSSLKHADEFKGLPKGVSRYDLLLLIKRVGKGAGFTPRMIALLDYYMAFTKDIDWERGSAPIVYQSLSKTALDLCVSERQVQKLEKLLFEKGALCWHDSGNHRRYGQRDQKSGRIIYAYGVDLSPLAALKDELEAKLEEKQLYDRAWMETKRQISWYRAQIRSAVAELIESGQGAHEFESQYKKISGAIRTYMSLEQLRALLSSHKEIHNQLKALNPADDDKSVTDSNESKMTQKSSCRDEQKFARIESTTHKPSNKLDSSKLFEGLSKRTGANSKTSAPKSNPLSDRQILERAGLARITLPDVLEAGSDKLKAYLPLTEPDWPAFIEAAYQLKNSLNISQASWAAACQLLGRSGAAICVLITDQAVQRTDEPVRKPAAYFAAMVERARVGHLSLDLSIKAFIERS